MDCISLCFSALVGCKGGEGGDERNRSLNDWSCNVMATSAGFATLWMSLLSLVNTDPDETSMVMLSC